MNTKWMFVVSIPQFLETKNDLLLVSAGNGICIMLPFMFIFCHFGENVKTAYLDLSDSIYGISWYLYPVKIQKLLPVILMSSAKPIRFESVGSLDCSYETFKSVNETFKSWQLSFIFGRNWKSDHDRRYWRKWYWAFSDFEVRILFFHDAARNVIESDSHDVFGWSAIGQSQLFNPDKEYISISLLWQGKCW